MQERLEKAGIRSQREEGVECCYARQTKFWVHDPDNTLWELYTLDDDDLDHRGRGQSVEVMNEQHLAGRIRRREPSGNIGSAARSPCTSTPATPARTR